VAGLRAAPMQGIYGMTKAAVISMTQTLAFELGGGNIRVNAIAPGLVETKFAAAIVANPMLRDHVIKRTPLARHAQPAEIAGRRGVPAVRRLVVHHRLGDRRRRRPDRGVMA
jgi:NAD(P)-dependent dehydrogenase (short-subunit alcohol dehydrogenase family)